MHLRAIIRPAVQFGVKMRTEQSVRGEVRSLQILNSDHLEKTL